MSLTIEQIREDAHTVLREWHKERFLSQPFSSLILYQKALHTYNDHIPETLHHLIDTALARLKSNAGNLEQILQLRFIQKEPAHAVATSLNLAESTIFKSQQRAIEELADILYEMERRARIDHKMVLLER